MQGRTSIRKSVLDWLVRIPSIRLLVEARATDNSLLTLSWAIAEMPRRLRLKISGEYCDTTLLSYPRSGNTLLRFFSESAFERPSLGFKDDEHKLHSSRLRDKPIFLRDDWRSINISNKKPIFVKRHDTRDLNNRIVLIVRKPAECILSHIGRTTQEVDEKRISEEVNRYFDIIHKFQAHPGPKMLIHYEDLVTTPQDELRNLSEFFGIGLTQGRINEVTSQMHRGKKVLVREADPELLSALPKLLPRTTEVLVSLLDSRKTELAQFSSRLLQDLDHDGQ